jgi:hypothetical protein
VAEKLAELKARIGTLHGPDTDHSSFSRCGPWLISCFALLCFALHCLPSVPLLERFNVELKELKEIVSQSLRGRIFTNKDGNATHSFDSDAWVGGQSALPVSSFSSFPPPPQILVCSDASRRLHNCANRSARAPVHEPGKDQIGQGAHDHPHPRTGPRHHPNRYAHSCYPTS